MKRQLQPSAKLPNSTATSSSSTRATMGGILSFGTGPWDPTHRFHTSWLLAPWLLFACRALFVRASPRPPPVSRLTEQTVPLGLYHGLLRHRLGVRPPRRARRRLPRGQALLFLLHHPRLLGPGLLLPRRRPPHPRLRPRLAAPARAPAAAPAGPALALLLVRRHPAHRRQPRLLGRPLPPALVLPRL